MPKKKETVLFVDDDPRALESFKRTLSKDFLVLTATGAKDGLEILEEHADIKVIISDLKMPEIDGIQFLEMAKAGHPDTVRILLTGYADFDNSIKAVNKGYIFRFLTKPCPTNVLKLSIADALRQYQVVADSRELHTLKKLQKVMDGIVAGLSTLLESRDPYTAGHQRRVAALSVAIGEELGFESDRLQALEIAARLHDIGKVYVPSDFLNKPGRLSPHEFAIIHQHPIVGADILKNVTTDWPIADFILQHHERIDGSGYPNKLKGKDILLESKILAIADVVDAMSSRRPYREELGLDAALDEIEQGMGTIYDRQASTVCLSLFRDKGYTLDNMSAF